MSENDYKYVIQDISRIFIGGNYTFSEMAEKEEMPYRVQAIAERVLLANYEDNCILAQELIQMKEGDALYRVMKRLRIKVRGGIVEVVSKPSKNGKLEYKSCLMGFNDFIAMKDSVSVEDTSKTVLVEEISFTKLALMSFPL